MFEGGIWQAKFDFNLTERFTPCMFVKSISTSELISGTKLDRIPSAGRFVKSFWRFDLTERFTAAKFVKFEGGSGRSHLNDHD
jgi:hypothetical protein